MEKAALVLLAGGASSRMGMPKGLLPYGDVLWLEEQLNRFSGVGKRVYIGLGYDYDLYFKKLPWLEECLHFPAHTHNCLIRSVLNPNPQFGSFSTLHCILNQIEIIDVSIFINPIDVPLPDKNLLRNMLVKQDKRVLIPVYKNRKGHPVLIDSVFTSKLKSLDIENPNARLDIQIRSLPDTEVVMMECNSKVVIMNLNDRKSYDDYCHIKLFKS
jgi:molybdenum cofactor cytidylyltransferase